MPEFILNDYPASKGYDALSDFAKGYVEAMFFTNCDSGDDNENRANQLGVKRLTKASIVAIATDCIDFQNDNVELIETVLAHGERDLAGIAHDLWFTRQGHGVGFWEGESRGYPGDTGEQLDAIAKGMGETCPYFHGGWIHV